jgi:Uma2 family endonuclease
MALLTGITIDDFEQLPDALAHNHELVKGELVDVSGNMGGHNGLRDALVELIRPYVREHKLGRIIAEQEFEFEEEVARGPDVSFFGPEKAKRFDRKLRVQRFVPDVAIEIASTNDKFEDLHKKALYYPEQIPSFSIRIADLLAMI